MMIWARLTYVPLVALAIVNIILTFDFWNSFGGHFAIAFQVVGVSFVLIELTGLVVYADLIARGEQLKSRWWLIVFVGVVLVNLFADYGAVVTRTAADAGERARARGQYEAAIVAETETSAEIIRLDASLDATGRNRPVAALRAENAELQRRIAWYDQRDRARPRRLASDATQTESALAMAEARERAIDQRDAARQTLSEFGAPPEREHPQFEAIATMLASLGMNVTPGTVRVWLALPIAIVLKLLQLLGFWVLSRGRLALPEPSRPAARAPEPPQSSAPKTPVSSSEQAAFTDALGAFAALSGNAKRH